MKYWVIALLWLGIATSCQQNEEDSDTPELLPASEIKNSNTLQEENAVTQGYPRIAFDKVRHDFGEIEQGQVVRYDFAFTNTGDGNLIITNVKASCGCTVAEYPKEPIAPGEGGIIPVEYNSRGRSNKFDKTVTVFANTSPNTTELYIQGFVTTK